MAKKPASKPAAKAKTKPKPTPKASTTTSTSVPALDKREESMSIRAISNGFIVRESWMEGSGQNQKYRERETFTKTKPTIVLPK
ncbi:MAG: hypothetical protein WA975_18200 [Mesorhizobium sp.]